MRCDRATRSWSSGESATGPGDSPVIAHVETVEPSADFPGWTSLSLDQSLDPVLDLTGEASVLAFRERLRPFGWNAPDPNRLVVDDKPPPGAAEAGDLDPPLYYWKDYEVTNPLVIDGDRPEIRPGSWLVLEGEGDPQAAAVVTVAPGGDALFAISGPFTTVTVDALVPLVVVDARRRVVVHAVSEVLPTAEEPDDSPIANQTVVVGSTDPPLPAGRSVVLEGTIAATGETAAAPAIVASAVHAGDGTMTLTLDRDVPAFSRQGLIVRANVVAATHGETVAAGARQRRRPGGVRHLPPAPRPADARARHHSRRRAPRADRAGRRRRVGRGPRPGRRRPAGPGVRPPARRGRRRARSSSATAYTAPAQPTGTENVTAGYRVGIGEAGAVGAGAAVDPRPPAARDPGGDQPGAGRRLGGRRRRWRRRGPTHHCACARSTGSCRCSTTRTSPAGTPASGRRAPTWCGTAAVRPRAALGARPSEARVPSAALLADLSATIDAVRDPAGPLSVVAGAIVSFGIRVERRTRPRRRAGRRRRGGGRGAARRVRGAGPRGSPTRSRRPQYWWSFAACPVWRPARCRGCIGFRPTRRSSGNAVWPACSFRRPRPLRRLPRCRVTSSPPSPAGGTAARCRRSCSPSPPAASTIGEMTL